MPVGVPGELYAGGDGLACGYLNRALTTERFIANPFSDEPEARLYKTGDLVRWLADGSIEFHGRTDLQVKIRGFRIELSEIETVLGQHPAVKECVVIAREETPGGKCLVAYVVTREQPAPTANELRSFLQEKLPDYMLPSAYVFLAGLPLSPNGKVDRRALPAPDDARRDSEKRYLAPRDAMEEQLARIWENVLGIRPIGVTDQFFELGGHSLLAVRVVAQIERAFSKQLPVAAIFESPTIEQLAAMLREAERRAALPASIVEIQPAGSKPPLFLVHGVGGGMFWGYTNLSHHLGPEQPIYAFKSRGTDGVEEFGTVEEMATQYVADLRKFQPHGPYHLGGYCFGGNVAYEMARQLQGQGEQIALLALMNSAATNSSYTRVVPTPAWLMRFVGNVCYLIGCYLRRTPKQQREFLRLLGRRIVRLFGRSRAPSDVNAEEVVDLSNLSVEERRLWDAHIRALYKHRPQPYGGHVTLFRSRGHQLWCSFDRTYGWGEFARGGVTVKMVPGAHEKILEEEHAQALA
ncbi:MAG TPA: alpha/beta fold hydrolase, partial [Lysobacter sp.]|nr:alpha/beta fold hydrolase [Lysobacter sp.]